MKKQLRFVMVICGYKFQQNNEPDDTGYFCVKCMNSKKPTIYLLTILPVLIAGAMAIIIGLISAYSKMAGIELNAIPNLNGILISLPAFFLWIPISFIISNLLLYFVPPLRAVAENYAEKTEGSSYKDSQKGLWKITLYMSVICLPLIAMGFVL